MTGRFLSLDPVLGYPENPQSWNRYAYVMGNPMRYTDPLGLVIDCVTHQGGQASDHAGLCVEQIEATATALAEPLPPDEFGDELIVNPRRNNNLGSQESLDIARSYYQQNFERFAGEGRHGLAFLNYSVNWLFVPKTELEAGLAALPPGRAVKGAEIVAKPASELIRATLKKSKSYHSEIEHLSRKALEDAAKGNGPLARAAKQMLKLIKQSPRLMEKEGGKFQ